MKLQTATDHGYEDQSNAQHYSSQLWKFSLLDRKILISQLSCGFMSLTLHLDSDFFVLPSSRHNYFFSTTFFFPLQRSRGSVIKHVFLFMKIGLIIAGCCCVTSIPRAGNNAHTICHDYPFLRGRQTRFSLQIESRLPMQPQINKVNILSEEVNNNNVDNLLKQHNFKEQSCLLYLKSGPLQRI